MKTTNLSAWLVAFRLRTLPLALSCIFMGSFLAQAYHKFRWDIFVWACITTILLQILSNIANDYGDSVSGIDNPNRQGPLRAVQAGKISKSKMKNAMVFCAILAFLSGIILLYEVFFRNKTEASLQQFFVFLALGLACIVAAITYTVGKKPYGYAGFGDISVLMFFGWVGVAGSFFLYTKTFEWALLLPATSSGLFAVGVLNLNNIRDMVSDKEAGKISIPVRLGRENAIFYHWALLLVGVLCTVIYTILYYKNPYQWAFLAVLPLLFRNAKAVYDQKNPKNLDPYLKQMALTTLFFVLLFGLGVLM